LIQFFWLIIKNNFAEVSFTLWLVAMRLGLGELKNLQIKRSGDSWSVKAPDSGLCTTDDVADALTNAAYLCMKHKKTGRPGDFIFI